MDIGAYHVLELQIAADPVDSRLGLIRARGESLPMPSGWFDLAISRVALLVLQELKANVRERHWRAALHRLYVLANGAIAHLTGRELASPYSGKPHSFQTPARIVRTLESLGFENIRVEQRKFFVVTATRQRGPK